MYEPALERLLRAAVERLRRDLSRSVPGMAERTWTWLEALSRGRPVNEYFDPDWGFPLLSLPWWTAHTLTTHPDRRFHADLIYSTINGYFHIRLIDDLMDDDASATVELLACAAFFHSRFHAPLLRHFPSDHPFWQECDAAWLGGHEAPALERRLESIDLAAFCDVSAAKTRAARIPVIAVCRRYGRPDLIPAWASACELVSRYVQMADDLFDWPLDASCADRPTYFLSEADRRRRPDESRAQWAEREGLSWAVDLCHGWLDEIEARASELGCGSLRRMVEQRRLGLAERAQQFAAGLREITRFGELFATWANGT
jgi:hypothetical protein